MKLFKRLISCLFIITSLLLALYHFNHKDIQWVSLNSYVGFVYNRNSVDKYPVNNNNEDLNHGVNKSHSNNLVMKEKDLYTTTKNENTVILPKQNEKGVVTSFLTQNDMTLMKMDMFSNPYTQEDQTVTESWREKVEDRENIMKVFEYRKYLLQEMCQKFRIRENSTHSGQDAAVNTTSHMEQEEPVEYVASSNFHLVRSASTMTCLINKVASTSLAVSLLKADGRPIPEWNEELSPHNAVTILKPKTQAEFNFARKHFFKFLLVRHPLERLLSAYRDKVERADHWSLKKLRQHIVNTMKDIRDLRMQRDENYSEIAHRMNTESQASPKGKTLSEEDRGFPNALSDQQVLYKTSSTTQDYRRKRNIASNGIPNTDQNDKKAEQTRELPLKGDKDSVAITEHTELATTPDISENRTRNGNETGDLPGRPVVLEELPDEGDEKETPLPTFGDFLEYILVSDADGDFSSHWTPYWERCTPCSIQYDVIAKLETADRDLSVVYERLGISQKNRKAWYNRSAGSKSPKRDILSHYYSQLNPFLIGRVYRRYAFDFHLFQYDIVDIFKLAGQCNTTSCEEVGVYL